jgi:hypothetical protein
MPATPQPWPYTPISAFPIEGGSPQPWRPSVGFAVFAVDYPLLPSERTAAISGLWIAAKIVRMFAMRLSDGPS